MCSRLRFFVPLASLLCLGCGRMWGPETLPMTTVAGEVRVGDRPLRQGWLEVLPVEATRGRLRSIPIGPDGRFRCDEVPVGRVGIRLAGAAPPPTGNPGLDAFVARARRTYELRREIRPEGRLVIDLQADYYASLPGASPK